MGEYVVEAVGQADCHVSKDDIMAIFGPMV